MGEEELSATVLFRYAKGQAGYSLAAETGVAANGNGAINTRFVGHFGHSATSATHREG